ncbi:MAG: S-adenosylmethionine decarboxylase [Gemmataceae bacterium]|nr:S-adenosylmethionine decarboxylase [Gemmataceae bacterium]
MPTVNSSPRPAPDLPATPPAVGVEWVVEAWGCDPARLRDPATVRGLCDRLLAELDLRAVAPPLWHLFPGPGGVTGLYLLAESHLACHTYPEHALATLNLYCCRPRRRWPWEDRLAEHLRAAEVAVRSVERGRCEPPPPPGPLPP